MEPIKITDKVTLRQEALRMAIMQAADDDSKDYVLSMAKDFESYLQGSADLPEYSDHEKKITDMFAKMQESFKPKPLPMWNSIPRYDDGTILAPWIDTLRQSIPFCMHDAKRNNTFFVADEAEFDHFANEIMKNPRYDAYCHVDIPPFTQPTKI